jgi:hypothetical protein
MTDEKYVSAYKAYLEELPKIEERIRNRLDGNFMPIRPEGMTDAEIRDAEEELDRECFPERYKKGRGSTF